MFNNELWQKPAGGAGGAGFYTHQIANSCRFDGAGKYLRTNGSAPTLATKYTFSTWIKRSKLSSTQIIFGAETDNINYDYFNFRSDNLLEQISQRSDSYVTRDLSVYRDTSAYYHLVFQWDTTLASATDRLKVYVNGVRLSWDQTQYSGALPQDTALKLNQNGASLSVAYTVSYTSYFNGYMAQTAGIDGSIVAIGDLGETKNGVWIAKDLSGLTFGNNGFLLDYASSSDMGNDVSGNNNDFTPTSISTHDQMLDSPTFNSSSNGGNFATMNPLSQGSYATLSEGNLKVTGNTGADVGRAIGNMAPTTGKWYFEINMEDVYAYIPSTGLRDVNAGNMGNQTTGPMLSIGMEASGALLSYSSSGQQGNMGTVTSTSTGVSSFSDGDIMMIAWDCENRKMWIGKNGTFFNSGNPASGSNPQFSWTAGSGISAFTPQCGVATSGSDAIFNFGQDGTFAGTKTAQGNSDDTGYGNFYYDPPTGYLALCTGNLPVADAVDPAQTDDDYPQKLFTALAYSGDGGGSQTTGFRPDWVWVKRRDGAQSNGLWDSSRGTTKILISNETDAEGTTSGLTAFNTDGYTMGNFYNQSGNTYASWSWRANAGTTSSNSNGSITSTVQADPSGGFSIVTWTGAAGAWGTLGTVGHGLSAAPTVILAKIRSGTGEWNCFFSDYGGASIGGSNAASNKLQLNVHDALYTNQTYADFGKVMPTSTVFTVNGNLINNSGSTVVAYCFTNIEGYIKSGTYVGNANDNGVFVYTGFKPSFFMCKPVVTGNWRIQDNKRTPFNVANKTLFPNSGVAELSNDSNDIDIVSNGVKMRASDSDYNQATTFVYLAIAENPFKYATAR